MYKDDSPNAPKRRLLAPVPQLVIWPHPRQSSKLKVMVIGARRQGGSSEWTLLPDLSPLPHEVSANEQARAAGVLAACEVQRACTSLFPRHTTAV